MDSAYNLFHTLKRKKTDNDKLEIVEKAGITQEELDRQNEHIPTNERRDINQEAGQKLNNYGISSDKRSHMQGDNSGIIRYAGAAATALVGILHLTLVPFFVGFGSSTSVFFVATGIAQLFWAVPLLKQWGRLWYFIGIGGTVILILCWNIVNAPLSVRGL